MDTFDQRPDPDAILEDIQTRHDMVQGRLKIFFGYAAGERVIIVMGAVCVMKPRVSGTLYKYISCIA